MTRSHELDHDRDHDELRRSGDAIRAPGRGTRAQDLDGPTGPLPSGILMRKQRDDNGVEPTAHEAVTRAASTSSGRALPDHLRGKFEQSLGTDLSGVRVHDGAASAASATAVGAKAYTLGNDIHFGEGHYDPASPAGEHLLAHEVAHTVQQSGSLGRRAQFKLEVSSPGDAHEVEADRAADAMVAGAPAMVSGGGVRVAREVETGNEGSVSASREGVKVTIKPVVKKKFPAKWVDVEIGGEFPIQASLERKEAGEGEASPEGGKAPPLASYQREAEQRGTEVVKHDIEGEIEGGHGDWDAEWEVPEIEHNSEGTSGGGITLKCKVKGHEVVVKLSGPELKKGEIEGPSAAVEVPFKLAEKTVWENADARLVASTELVVTAKVTPKWEEIGKAAMEKFGDKLLELAERGAMTTLEAMGSVAGLTAGFVLVAGAMVFAGIMDSIETSEVEAAVASGRKQIDQATAAAMDAYGVRPTTGTTSSFAMAAYTAAWNQVAEAFIKAKNDERFAKFNFDLFDPKLRAEVAKSMAPNFGVLESRARRAATHNVSRGVAQAYYDMHAGSDAHTDAHVSVEAQKICGRLDPENGSSWSPAPAVHHLDHGVDGAGAALRAQADRIAAQAEEAKAKEIARQDQALRDQQDADAQNCSPHRDAEPIGQSVDPSLPQQSQEQEPVWGQSKVE